MTRLPLVLLVVSGCFDPKFQNGVPCSADRQCPGDQICAADDRCYDADEVPDFDDAGVDAPDDVLRVVEIVGGGSPFQEAVEHTCAVLSDGALRCFGDASLGQLGLGTEVTYGDNEPARSAPFVELDGVVSAGTGFDMSCAVLDNGSVRCWGSNAHYELGLGNNDPSAIGDNELPSSVAAIEVGGAAAEACGGDTYSCVRLAAGQVRCFGLETNSATGGSALGLPGVTEIGREDKPDQFPTIDLGASPIVDIDCGSVHVCGVNDAGAVICWGTGTTRLGYPGLSGVGFDDDPIETGFVDVGGTVSQIAAGDSHTCALLENGSVRCWGSAAQLGIAATEDVGDDEPPSAADTLELGGVAEEIKANGNMTCARLEGGAVRCWGFPNGHAADPVGDNELPTAFSELPLPGPAVSLGVGFRHACAILENHDVYCWGKGASGALGYGDTDDVGIGTRVDIKGPVPIL